MLFGVIEATIGIHASFPARNQEGVWTLCNIMIIAGKEIAAIAFVANSDCS